MKPDHYGRSLDMIAVTSRAKEALNELRENKVHDPEAGLRLAPSASGRLELFPDQQRPGDQVVEHIGSKVLLVDGDLADALSGAEIDCETTSSGRHLVIRPSDDDEDDGGVPA